MPGYGRSDKPDVTYDCEWINGTLIGLVDALGAERVVIAGHDWGGLLVWIMARQYPERIAGVIGVNTPDLPRPPMPPVAVAAAALRRTAVSTSMQFQDRGVAEWVFSWGGRAARRLRRDDLRRPDDARTPRRFRPRCSTCTSARSGRWAR